MILKQKKLSLAASGTSEWVTIDGAEDWFVAFEGGPMRIELVTEPDGIVSASEEYPAEGPPVLVAKGYKLRVVNLSASAMAFSVHR